MITIVGLGALGSEVALFLRNMKQGLKGVDGDRIEMKNTQAQFHTKMTMSQNKARALQSSLLGLFGVKIDITPHMLTNDNAKEILVGSDLIIDCTDNIEARRIIMEVAKHFGIPCLHGALSAGGDFGQAVWTEMFNPDDEGEDGEATCIDGEHLPFFAFAGSFVAMEAQNFLKTGKKRSWQISPAGIQRIA